LTAPVNADRFPRDFIAVGASAGGVEALRTLFSLLPDRFPAVMAVVLHRSPSFSTGNLLRVLAARTPHTILEPENDERMEPARIYVAPRDRHLVVDDGRFCLNRNPKQHFTRPAIDPLFQSAAQNYGRRVVGLVLSGSGEDGVDGLIAIKAAGGISIAQDPSEAGSPRMPRSAILFDHVDVVLPVAAIPEALMALARGKAIATANNRAS